MAENILEKLNPGKFCQVGFVVSDRDKMIQNYEENVGIGPFNKVDFKPEKNFIKGRGGDLYLKIGLGQLTPEVQIEFIEVAEGKPYHADYLEENGQGVQHLGFITDDYDGVIERAEAMGIDLLMSAETFVEGMGNVRGAYLDTYNLMGIIVEIIEVK